MEGPGNFVSKFEQALLSLDRLTARRMLTDSLSSGERLQSIEKMVVPALEKIGRGWEDGKIALSQVYMSGRICEELIASILPSGNPDRKKQPKMAIASLEDYHLLGKRMVYSMLRASGFDLLDYGHGLSAKDIIKQTLDDKIDILLISVLMLSSALKIKDVRTGLNEPGIDLKIVVGGAPFRFDDQLWKEVGADAMGKTASDAVALVNKYTKGSTDPRSRGFE